jgi:hypothetical protein
MPDSPITYRIDAADRLTAVSEQWDTFARANQGGASTASAVIGRSLWDFISDATTTELYRQVLARIRAGRAMTYSFRCDSPECQRLLEMRIRLVDETGAVEFRTETLFSGARALPPVSQGDGSVGAEPEEMIRMCGWCNRIDVAGEWLEVEQAMPRLPLMEYPAQSMLTHGICEVCLARMTAEVEALV